MKKLLPLLLVLFAPITVFAYPEMAKYGYVNCNSCHVSLNGGGILNDYGRQIAGQELAIWGSKDEKDQESQFAYGLLSGTSVQKWLKMGGDVRSVYYYQNTAAFTSGQAVLMQADLEAAIIHDHFTIVGSGGATQPGFALTVQAISRKHYLQYEFSDTIRLRVGKFIPSYGILTPDHMTLTKSALELGYNYESYNAEASYLSERFSLLATGVFGRPDQTILDQDQGFAIQAAFAPTEQVKFGLNTWYGKKKYSSRWLYGAFAMAGITEKLFASTEIDLKSYSAGDHGIATTQRLSYELLEGLWFYGTQEYGTTRTVQLNSNSQVYGLGLQIFPRSHFEFNLAYEKISNQLAAGALSDTTSNEDVAWFMSHYYF